MWRLQCFNKHLVHNDQPYPWNPYTNVVKCFICSHFVSRCLKSIDPCTWVEHNDEPYLLYSRFQLEKLLCICYLTWASPLKSGTFTLPFIELMARGAAKKSKPSTPGGPITAQMLDPISSPILVPNESTNKTATIGYNQVLIMSF